MTELDRHDIQGLVLRGYGMPLATYLFYRFDTAASARRWLASMIDPVTSAAEWEAKPPWCANLALTYPGLMALELPPELLADFPYAFQQGMAARSVTELGDAADNRPAHWDATPPFASQGVHAMLMVWAQDQAELDARLAEFSAHADEAGRITLVGSQPVAALSGGSREHFGYRDPISQPAIGGDHSPEVGPDGEEPIAAGEFLLGYPDELGHTTTLTPEVLGLNGTYAVYRKMHQDVAGFRAFLGSDDAEQLAARLMGRWRSGAPMALAARADDPDLAADRWRVNAFDYTGDPVGYLCPRGAHVRRARPRDGSPTVRRRRLIRRGMPYGQPLPDAAGDDGLDRGLVGIFFNADIERQYEYVQRQWLDAPSFDGLWNAADPLLGPAGRDFTWQRRPVPRRRVGLPRFVDVRGGEYFFVPGISALQFLSTTEVRA
jgi:Dyp-type peroxidase family